MSTSTSTKKTSILTNKWLRIIFTAFLSLYLIIWAISSPVSKYFIKPILLEQGLTLSDDASIRYNPFLSQLTISDLSLTAAKNGVQETVLSVKALAVRLTLFQLLFDEIVVSKFELTDVYLKVEKTPTQLIIAGVDLNKNSAQPEEEQVPEVESTPLPYQLILPELSLNQINVDINNDEKRHKVEITQLLISQVIASQQSQKALLSLKSLIDDTAVELSADADFIQGQGEVNSQLSIANYPISKLEPYIEQLSQLSGSFSLTSKQQLRLSPEQIKLHVNEATLSNVDLVAGIQEQFFNLEKLENTITDLKLTLSQGEITDLSGMSQLTLNKAGVHYQKASQKLAYFEQLALNDISFHFVDEPQVKIASIVMDDIYGSKNEETELPPIMALKQFSISDIFVSAKQLSIDKIILDSLQSDVILSKEKVLANLVALPTTKEEPVETEIVESEIVNTEVVEQNNTQAEATTPKDSFLISLNEFSLINENQILFVDNSVTPQMKRYLYIDTLSLGALSNADDKKEQEIPFELIGRSNKYAHFDFKGFTKPFSPKPTYHLKGFLKELSLPSVSRYMKQAIQMEFKSGQLNTTVDVTLVGDQIDGNVDILLGGLETAIADSDEAGSLIDQGALPFNMALGMLKDGSGDVELGVPLSGSTSDPGFGVSSIVTLITQKAIWMATQDYLMTTFVPYANIVSAAMTVGEFALKLRFEDLIYQTKQIEPDDAQKAYLDAFIGLMQEKEDVRVNICAISIPEDINLPSGVKVTDKEQIQQLKDLGEQREEAFKDYMVTNGNIASARLLLCSPKIDSSEDAKPRIELSV